MSDNTGAMRQAWGAQACKNAPLAGFTFHGGTRINVNQHALDAFAALDYVLAHHGYPVRSGETGAYNCRAITGGTGYSLHAMAIAVDINWNENPYQTPAQYAHGLKTDMPRAMVDDVYKIRTGNGKQVWGWGGDYGGNKDPMHFELHVTPADLTTGVVGINLDQIPITPANPTADPVRPATGVATIMAVAQFEHPSDHRMEKLRVNLISKNLELRWQTQENGPWVPYWSVLNVPGVPNSWDPNSLSWCMKADGNFQWSATNTVDGKEYMGWYKEVAAVGNPVGWKGPQAL